MRKCLAILFLLIHYLASGQNAKELYFQPIYAGGLPISKIFEEVNYIPLQTNNKCLFGKIKKLIVSDAYFIIWDTDTNAIYFFNKKGEFVKKYRPPNCNIKSVQLDKKRNAIFISGSNKNFDFSPVEIEKMLEDPINKTFARFTWSAYYDLNNVQDEKVEKLKGFSLSLIDPTIFNGQWWAYSYVFSNRKFNDKTDNELKVYDGEKPIREYFLYNKKNDAFYYKPERVSFFPTNDTASLLFTRPYQYNIYRLTKDSASILYRLILPMENSLPKAFFTHPFHTRNDILQYKELNGSIVWDIANVYKIQNLLFFSLNYNKSWRDRNFLFDESTGRFYNTSKISGDSTNAYLPVLISNIQFADDEYLYSSATSGTMFLSKDNNQLRNPKYSPVMQKYFEAGKRTDNPVIIQLKLKNKIG